MVSNHRDAARERHFFGSRSFCCRIEALDVSPRRMREVLSAFLTHLVAAGLGAANARARLVEKVTADGGDARPGPRD
jgi:hypothetical protein